MAERYDKALATAIESGMDNMALAIEEQRVGEALVLAADATERIVREAIRDGLVSRHEITRIHDALFVLWSGIYRSLALDEQDAQNGRAICGAHEELTRRRHEPRGTELVAVA